MKLYTEAEIVNFLKKEFADEINAETFMENLTPIGLPSDEEMEEKLNVAYGNGYEQGEMDFYKKMQEKGKLYADGYAEGYKRAIELTQWTISNLIPNSDESNN
jgi:hypothetical protein